MKNTVLKSFQWIQEDWRSDRGRFVIEFVAWIISIGSAFTMAYTAPNPPLIWMYPIWAGGVALYGWGALSRKSFSMLANAVILFMLDCWGYYNVLTAQ